MSTDLVHRSIEIILENQHPSGAYIACPNFPSYQYCWYRDSSYTAYAMDLVGEYESAAHFHDWGARQVNARANVVQAAISEAGSGRTISSKNILHTRYHLDGSEGITQEWPNFQLDGFGTWLWSLHEHTRITATPLPDSWLHAADLVAAYLEALWGQPCFDCWEEFPNGLHPHTLAAIYGGLKSHAEMRHTDHSLTLDTIRASIIEHNYADGHFAKFPASPAVDASLLGLSLPYQVFSPDDPRILSTVKEIESTLSRGGGIHRYAADTYYGGGEWVLLTAWLGWYHAVSGVPDGKEKATQALNWVEAQFTHQGLLPEQIPCNLNDTTYYQPWVDRWGPIATPLLWSHALHIILSKHIL